MKMEIVKAFVIETDAVLGEIFCWGESGFLQSVSILQIVINFQKFPNNRFSN